MASARFLEVPLIRALLRTLLFTAAIEAIFYRLLTIPAGPLFSTGLDLHASTERAGLLMFMIGFAVLLFTLPAIAYASLRAPAWSGSLNPFVALGLLTITALGLSAAIGTRGPIFALGFSLFTAGVGIAMLAGMYESRSDAAGRIFAVLLAAATVCATLTQAAELADRIAPFRAPFPLPAVAAAGRWMLIGAGLAAFPTFAPATAPRPLERAAGVGFSAVSAFTLILGAVVHPIFLSRIGSSLGLGAAPPVPAVLKITAAATAVFLVVLTASRCFAIPEARGTAYGLAFLLLAGDPHRIAYEHLLALAGVALLTAREIPKPMLLPLALTPGAPPPRDV